MKNIISRIIVAIIAITLAMTAHAGQGIITVPRSSSMDFNKIEVSGNIHLIIEERTEGNLVIRGTESAINNLDIAVRKGTLHASMHGFNSGKNPIEIRMPYNGRIDEIDCGGASHVRVIPTLTGRDIELEAEGASRIDANVSAAKVDISSCGASFIKSDIVSDSVEIDCEGASKADITGKASYAEIDAEGACKVKAFELETVNMKAEAEGASDVEVYCTGTLTACVSGASSISYKGDCHVSSTISGPGCRIEKAR